MDFFFFSYLGALLNSTVLKQQRLRFFCVAEIVSQSI